MRCGDDRSAPFLVLRRSVRWSVHFAAGAALPRTAQVHAVNEVLAAAAGAADFDRIRGESARIRLADADVREGHGLPLACRVVALFLSMNYRRRNRAMSQIL